VTFYLDTSVLIPTLIAEPSTEPVGEMLLEHPSNLIVSAFTVIEVASALSSLVRMNRLAAAEASALLVYFDEWRGSAVQECDLTAADYHLANLFVRRFDLKLHAPDALHAAICQRQQLQLVTLDRRLADAARELGIDAIVPAA
jgi:uncharacterized protein